LDISGSDAEEKAEGEIRVLLRALSPSGQILFEQEIDIKYLSNPVPLWQKLPDGRYQIVVIEPGRPVPIVVRDVDLKQHKVIRRFDQNRRGPNTSQLENRLQSEAVSLVLPTTTDLAGPMLPDEVAADAMPDRDQVWENWRKPSAHSRLTEPAAESGGESAGSVEVAAAATIGLSAQMTRFSKRALSPAAKLRRRLNLN